MKFSQVIEDGLESPIPYAAGQLLRHRASRAYTPHRIYYFYIVKTADEKYVRFRVIKDEDGNGSIIPTSGVYVYGNVPDDWEVLDTAPLQLA